LLYGELLLKVEAENGVHFLAASSQTSDEQDFGGANLHALEPPDGLRNSQGHKRNFFLRQVESLDCVKCAFISVVAAEDKDGCVVVKACTCLTSLLSQFESGGVRVVPFVCFHIVVFTTAQLLLFKGLVAAKCVNQAFVVNCWEKRLFYRHGASDFELAISVKQVVFSSVVSSKQIPAVRLVNVDHSEERTEIRPVFTPHSPGKGVCFNFNLLLGVVAVIFHHLLLLPCCNQLRYLQAHPANSLAPILKPQGLGRKVAAEIVLLTVGLKKVGLRQVVILRLHFFVHTYFVFILEKFILVVVVVLLRQTFCHSWRYADEILI